MSRRAGAQAEAENHADYRGGRNESGCDSRYELIASHGTKETRGAGALKPVARVIERFSAVRESPFDSCRFAPCCS
jgi:hypothetical protein